MEQEGEIEGATELRNNVAGEKEKRKKKCCCLIYNSGKKFGTWIWV